MKRSIFVLVITGIFIQCKFSFTQENEFRFRRISSEQGLSQSSVLSITQDKFGFMWFATLDGLNKFDGYNFTVYRNDPDDSSSLRDIGIRKLFTDIKKDLWVITLNGKLEKFDYIHDRFQHYNFDSIQNGRNLRIVALTESPEKKLYAGAMSGELFVYSRKNNTFTPLKMHPESGKPKPVIHLQSLCTDNSGNIWMGTWEGLIRRNLKSGKITRWFRTADPQNKLRSDILMSVVKDKRGKIWAAMASGGIGCYDPSLNFFKEYYQEDKKSGSLPTDRVMSIYVDDRLNTWIGTIDAGLCILENGSETFMNFRTNDVDNSSIGNGAVMSFFQDESGGIWIGTSGGGVSRFDYLNQRFHSLKLNSIQLNDHTNPSVLSVLEDKTERTWIGTEGQGLICRNRNGEFFRYLTNPLLGSNSITALLEDSKGAIWAVTDPGINSISGGIYVLYNNNNQFVPFRLNGLKIGGIQCMLEDSKGKIWFGAVVDGLFCYNPASGKTVNYKKVLSGGNSICGNSIFSLLEDSEGCIWIGTQNTGLSRYDPVKNKFYNFSADPSKNGRITSNSIWSLYQDDKNNIWVGTWGGGLNFYDFKTNSFNSFSRKQGLSSDVISAIVPDDDGNIWLGTNKGLTKFTMKRKVSKNYYKADGLHNAEFNQGAACRSKDGRLYFGGVNGIDLFNPRDIKDNKFIAPIMVTGIYLKEQPYKEEKQFYDLNKIVLTHNENFFSIEFASLDYRAPEKNQFLYKLSGIDKDWVYTNNIRRAYYTDISPGKYIFRLKGTNSDGIWSPSERTLSIIITPPFWQTWWFRCIIIIILGAIAYLIHRYRLKKLLEVERTRMRIAKDLHDDVSATLTGIAYFSNAISKELGKERTPVMQKLITLIQESTEEVQEGMHDIIWSINPENDRWDVILPKFRRFASDLCESRNISYSIDLPADMSGKAFIMEKRRNLWLVFKELITNAVKHSECSRIEIAMTVEKFNLVLRVADNGKGFDPSTHSDREGLKNIKTRAENLRGTAALKTQSGDGTEWKISVPL